MEMLYKRKLEKLLCCKYAFLRVILLAFVLAVGNQTAWAQFVVDGITYTANEDGKTCYVSSCSSSLTEVVIPETVTDENGNCYSVTSIEDYAFWECIYLTSINIPSSVNNIVDLALTGCFDLISINVDNANETYSSKDGVLFNKDFTDILAVPGAKQGEYAIPNTVKSIGDCAFLYCSSLTSIEIPVSITSIGDGAFSFCGGLTSVEIPTSVTSIGDGAFMECSSLTSVEIPSSVTSIGNSAFRGCSSLTSVEIPSSVTIAGNSAFYNCNGLTSVYSLSTTPPVIGSGTFEGVDKSACILYVPEGCISSYAVANGWNGFTCILEIGSSAGISVEEWEILMAVREDLMKKGWDCPWDISLGVNGVGSFMGLTIVQSHVVGLDLSNSNLTGDFPWIVLDLPYLEELNLSGNNLSGDIGLGMLAAAEDNHTATENLKKVDISNNKFSGNISLFANSCPALQYLDASGNCISDVMPAISSDVTTLNLKGQAIDKIVDVNLADFTPEGLPISVPTIWTYNHEAQTYNKPLELLCTTGELSDIELGDWEITIKNEEDWLAYFFCSSEDLFNIFPARTAQYPNVYYGESGDILNAMFLDYSMFPIQNCGTLKLRLTFAPGDANFSGDVDVTDLQAIILQIFGRYDGGLFNYTAANTVKDETLNVQDVVGEVNLLLSSANTVALQKRSVQVDEPSEPAAATVYCHGNELRICSEEPVAAFDLLVSNTSSLSVSDVLNGLGMVCAMQETANGVRIIGYSLSGGTLPAGENVIALCDGSNAYASSAVLSDMEAKKISTVLNVVPTSVGSISEGTGVSVGFVDGQLVIDANEAEDDVRWSAATSGGQLVGEGVIAQGTGRKCISLDVRGIVIVKIESGRMKLTKKIINNK